jgi:copper chaperone CopZ
MKKLIALFAMAAAVVSAQAAEVSLKVDGLVCEKGCLTKVKKSLGDVKGVNLKGSKFATGKKLGAVKVSFCDKTTTKNKIMAAIKKAGYKVAEAPKKAKGKGKKKTILLVRLCGRGRKGDLRWNCARTTARS